jgi:hypothetical protein
VPACLTWTPQRIPEFAELATQIIKRKFTGAHNMVTTDTMLVGSFKDRSLSNLHVKKKIRRLSYAPFPRKGNQGYSNKKPSAPERPQHKQRGKKKNRRKKN